MDEIRTRPRCTVCGRGVSFADWRRGIEWCADCDPLADLVDAAPAATFARGGAATMTMPPPLPARPASQPASTEVPDELIDELVAALEREERPASAPSPQVGLGSLVEELGLGRSPGELPWATWGFAVGFGANIVLAKYSQVTSGGSFTSMLGPLLIGGLVAGAACAGIGWGLAKLRDRG